MTALAYPTLFDPPDPVVADDGIDWEGLEDVALLYTATDRGNHSGIKFAASREDAQAWCESAVSRGNIHGTDWAYFWTSAATFLRAFPPPLVLTGLVDNGEWDERIAAAGVRKIALDELADQLTPLGVQCAGFPVVVSRQ